MTKIPSDYDLIPPANNPVVARLMREKGLNRTQAYSLAKREAAKAIDTSDVQPSQRLSVMRSLLSDPEPRTIPGLLESLHHFGVKIDAHDAVKTLWALQKLEWITFRQRAHGDFYAIKVKSKGYEGYHKLVEERTNGKAVQQAITIVEAGAQAEAAALAEAEASAELESFTYHPLIEEASVAPDHDPDMQTQMVEPIPPELHDDIRKIIEVATPYYDRLPLIADLIARGDKADQLNAAAKILEEAGEDDLAIQIYAKSGISPLEGEVLQLIHWIEEGII